MKNVEVGGQDERPAMKKPAFLLIQMTIYIALLTLVTVLATRFLGSLLIQQWQWRRSMTDRLQLTLAMDVLSRDVTAARCEQQWWGSEECVFRIDAIAVEGDISTVDIGWRLKGDVLQRVEGDFDYRQKVWSEKTTSVVAENVNDFVYQLATNPVGDVVSVEIEYETPRFGKRTVSIPLINGREV